MAEKPFEPTPTWIARAKREGNVARSQELSGICSLLLGTLAVAVSMPSLASVAAAWIARTASDERVHVEAIVPVFGIVLGVLAVAACGGVTASLLQERPFFIFPKLKPDRLNPLEGLKRMFSREAVVSAARAVLAFVLALGVTVPAVRDVFARGAGVAPLAFFASLAASAGVRIVIAVIAVGAAFAIADVILVRGRWRKKLRMSAHELKRDMRESEGDPLLRGRRRALHRMLGAGSVGRVRDAAFVITNPTHIAIAIAYRPPDVAVPRVLVRAADDAAARARELAREYGVPLVENVALARRLYASTQPGDEIPVETYLAVAQIVNALSERGVPV